MYNKSGLPFIVHDTYGIIDDSCLRKGTPESCPYAEHLGFWELIACGGDNGIIIHCHPALSFTKNVAMRYEVYGWRCSQGRTATGTCTRSGRRSR